MKRRLVIIGANDFQDQLIRKAKAKGYETHVFAWENGAIGAKTADFFYPISIVEKESILEVCKKIHPVGICSIASDLAVPTVNYIASRLGLTSNSEESSTICTNKHSMRDAFEQNGDPSPKSILFEQEMDINAIDVSFPVIVKPTDRSGSRGITKVENRVELKSAVERAVKESFEKKVLIEEFAEGEEYSVEFVSWRGKHTFLALTKKFTTGVPYFIEIGHLQPAPITPDRRDKIIRVVMHALDSLQIQYGASHAEVKVDASENIKIIEIGARMGGDCIGSDLVQISTGYDFLNMVIDISCGIPPCFQKICEPRYAIVRFVFSEKDLECFTILKQTHSNAFYRISPIESFDGRTVLDSAKRYGYYILATSSEEEKQEILKVVGVQA